MRGIFTGILGVVSGSIVLSHPLFSTVLTTSFLVWFLGIAALVYGINGMVTGIRLRKKNKAEWSMILGGIFSICFGIVLMVSPLISAIAILKILGGVAVAGGITLIAVAFVLRNKVKKLN